MTVTWRTPEDASTPATPPPVDYEEPAPARYENDQGNARRGPRAPLARRCLKTPTRSGATRLIDGTHAEDHGETSAVCSVFPPGWLASCAGLGAT